ncbi:MAG: alpha/beta hydrolase [Pirellula sp.]|nr:alpha/beta hydrolase [Pirellula sp.]
MRSLPLLLAAILAAHTHAAEPRIVRDVPYAEPANPRQMLDVYAPAEGKNLPVIVWIHGGGWRRGDKASVQLKPAAFNERGFVFVSTTYRFVPDVSVKEMTGDVARAIRWVHDHAAEYGGDGKRIIVMGHSAGAHLAALVCTDESYLKSVGLSLEMIKGCVPIDVSMYDIPTQMAAVSDEAKKAAYRNAFGDEEASHRALSPAQHVAAGKHIPPFLILYCADRAEAPAQSKLFAAVLQKAGISAEAFAGKGKTHTSISADIGKPDDPPTLAIDKFLDDALKAKP